LRPSPEHRNIAIYTRAAADGAAVAANDQEETIESNPAEDPGFRLLRGPTSPQLFRRSQMFTAAGLPFLWAIMFESKFKSIEVYYGWTMAGMIFACCVLSLTTLRLYVRKRKAEAAAGYTPWIVTAADRPSLFLLDGRTLQVISRPYEARPAKTSRMM
jgi:hypothetical protein